MTNKVTKETLEKLKQELEELKSVRKPQVAELMKNAVAEGDISESSEYEVAKDELSKVEGKIHEISQKIATAEVVSYNGTTFELLDPRSGDKVSYSIVLPDDADPTEGKISQSSPVGKALSGAKAGDTVKVAAPGGEMEFKVLKVV